MGVKGWSVVFKGDRLQAELIAASLEADGLRVEVFGDNAYGVGIDLTEARLMVPDEEAERARRLIKAAQDAPLPGDEEAEDADAPNTDSPD
jgi:Putative prokaryotic signal transducing protein